MTTVRLLFAMAACVSQLASCALDSGPDDREELAQRFQGIEETPSVPLEDRCVPEWQMCVQDAQAKYDACVTRTPVTTCIENYQAMTGICERKFQNCMRGSPIVLDLGLRGFRLTDARHGVDFDIDGDGELNRTGWLARGTQDAFLARDLNANGQIDDGKELFGDATELLDGSRAAHGYVALAELDSPEQGGNSNGYLERRDDAYRELLLWNDANHDGVSQPQELSGLLEHDIVALGLVYTPSSQIDAHGNHIAYVSVAYAAQARRLVQRTLADVFFVLEDPR